MDNEVGRKLTEEDEEQLCQRPLALAGEDVSLFVDALAVTVDDVFAVECAVLVTWLLCPKAVGIGCNRVRLMVG